MSKKTKPASTQNGFTPLPWVLGAGIFLLVFFAYRPAASGGFIWDDDSYVSENDSVQQVSGLDDIWLHPSKSPQYYPMVFTTFWVQAKLGSGPRGFHELNILLHAASAILLWRILTRLAVPGAYLAALIFAVHPVMVESVAWITERKNTLSLLFYLLALGAYLRFLRMDAQEDVGEKRTWGFYVAAAVLFVFALWSKTVTASLPAAILLVIWWKRGRLRMKEWVPLLPFFLLGIAGGAMTTYLEHSTTNVGASGPEWDYSIAQRILIAGRAVWFYVVKLVWPAKLTFIYPKWNVDAGVWWQWIFPAMVVAVVAVLIALRGRIGRGPVVAVLFFVGTLVPALGFINVFPMRYTFVADHYQYHASIGLIVLAAAGLVRKAGRSISPVGIPIAGVAIGLLLILTMRQCGIYQDRLTLWTDTTQKSPNSWMAWINLGLASRANNPRDIETPARYFERALELAPNISDPHYNVGIVQYDRKNYIEAEAEFRRAIEIEPRQVDAMDMLGYTLVAEKRIDEGVKQFRAALALNPDHTLAHFHLGEIFRDQGKFEDAAKEFEVVVANSPRYPPALRELANCRIKLKHYDKAIELLERFLKLVPNDADAHFDLGVAMLLAHRSENEAREHLNRAVAMKPELGERLRKTLGK